MLKDPVLLGILLVLVAVILWSAEYGKGLWKKIYQVIPPLLLCYALPGILHWPLGFVNASNSALSAVATNYILPASLFLLCVQVDLFTLWRWAPKSVFVFLAGSVGIILGAPIALWIVTGVLGFTTPWDSVSLTQGLGCLAGSWIGGSANMAAMKAVYQVPDAIFSAMMIVDVIVAYSWLALLIYGMRFQSRWNTWIQAHKYQGGEAPPPPISHKYSDITLGNLYLVFGIGFGGSACAHVLGSFCGNYMQSISDTLHAWKLDGLTSSFFWTVLASGFLGILISMTNIRHLLPEWSSQIALAGIYFLVATMGLNCDFSKIFDVPVLLLIGLIWLMIHILFTFLAAYWLQAPYLIAAIASMANVGGAASATAVAASGNKNTIPIAVMLAILGYAIGNYGAVLATWCMQWVITP